jgi:1-acyl-sn-glycerol-3-phosphate acyltransferase
MSDFTYRLIRTIGWPAFWTSSSPVFLHHDRVPPRGPVILAPTHLSHYDVPCLMAANSRNLDFMSVVEFLKNKWVARLFRAMNCFFLDRGRHDAGAVREAVRRLQAGRMIVMFPEGRIRTLEESVVLGKPFKPGIARLAILSGAPVVPCVVLNTAAYKRFTAWLPLKRTRYGVNFGHPITPPAHLPPEEAEAHILKELAAAYISLYQELAVKLGMKDEG